ncbi:serine O-acetyltransferase [Microvirga tunisiensis]|uniref:Serine acetyltransferase n=2 Tax=Pannonibacter tanglangensis TaxID=2750084 RepID=A0A7X5J7C0_9HYPH|nr:MULTISPECIES: serine O-acetyltransferase [unclassified Pannonibacter]NBN63633.1 serine O-acetyltransferase [Pannonibacter sp. XCT-34]NBN77267.1 serine O-acetyltransferase [Pannonibacter sp. XCT-53]
MVTTPVRQTAGAIALHDPVWQQLRDEAGKMVLDEPALSSFVYETVLNHQRLEDAVIHRLGDRLGRDVVSASLIRQTYQEALLSEPDLGEIFRVDIMAVFDRDPACNRLLEPVLYFKGFHALQTHRLANWLWRQGRGDFALYLQSRSSEVFQVDIHPAVPVGRGIFIDHATGLVVGSTAVIEDDVSILQGVTLGGTGKDQGDRHPKIRKGVLIGAGAKILGNLEIGRCSRIAAGSVVLQDVPCNTTVAGVPARVVGQAGCAEPARSMDQIIADKEQAG